MNFKLTFFVIILSLNCFGQSNSRLKNYGLENYQWDKLVSITIQDDDMTEYNSDEEMLDDLENESKRQLCENIRKWKSAFATLPFGPNKDIANEKTFIIFCEFKNGLKIPFRYFPNQYAIYDMRKEYHYYYTFPEQNNRMRNVADVCIGELKNKI